MVEGRRGLTIRLLGSGGADGIPAIFGKDPVSEYARQVGGPEIRTRASAIIDSGLKIDIPPENSFQLMREGLRATDWDLLLFTHSDEDHLNLAELQYALYPFTDEVEMPFPIGANSTVLDIIRDRYRNWPMELVELQSFQPYHSTGYQIVPLKATHTPGEECFNFLIEREGRRLIYATDTGIWSDETIDFLRNVELDLLVIECTNAYVPSTYLGHLDFEGLSYVLDRLRTNGTLHGSSRVVTTHHAASGGARHCDLVTVLAPLGAEPGYDGMLITV